MLWGGVGGFWVLGSTDTEHFFPTSHAHFGLVVVAFLAFLCLGCAGSFMTLLPFILCFCCDTVLFVVFLHTFWCAFVSKHMPCMAHACMLCCITCFADIWHVLFCALLFCATAACLGMEKQGAGISAWQAFCASCSSFRPFSSSRSNTFPVPSFCALLYYHR